MIKTYRLKWQGKCFVQISAVQEAVWKQGEIAKMQKRQKEVEKELKAEESKWQEAQERFFKTLAKVKEQADDPTLPSKYIALQSLSEFRQAHSRYMDQLQNIEEKHLAERDEKVHSSFIGSLALLPLSCFFRITCASARGLYLNK